MGKQYIVVSFDKHGTRLWSSVQPSIGQAMATARETQFAKVAEQRKEDLKYTQVWTLVSGVIVPNNEVDF